MEKTTPVLDAFDTVWERVGGAAKTVVSADGTVVPAVGKAAAATAAIPVTVLPRPAATADAATAVTQDAPAPLRGTAEDAAALRAAMDSVAVTYRTCCYLARRCSGCAGRTCAAIAASAKRTIERLSAQYFLLTGEVYSPGGSYARPASLGGALRTVIASENSAIELLTALEQSTAIPSLRRACLCAIEECERRICTAERLLISCGI
ncbi:MAG: hypothetical protein LBS90_08940 [Oscillospiraceae bacterium]|nr:hypothetical protein [Oscillospiraceae bacterium]